jgi:hypothetical protein
VRYSVEVSGGSDFKGRSGLPIVIIKPSIQEVNFFSSVTSSRKISTLLLSKKSGLSLLSPPLCYQSSISKPIKSNKAPSHRFLARQARSTLIPVLFLSWPEPPRRGKKPPPLRLIQNSSLFHLPNLSTRAPNQRLYFFLLLLHSHTFTPFCASLIIDTSRNRMTRRS